eukprot:9642031-Alexandrium_andersonii.AAC.1
MHVLALATFLDPLQGPPSLGWRSALHLLDKCPEVWSRLGGPSWARHAWVGAAPASGPSAP